MGEKKSEVEVLGHLFGGVVVETSAKLGILPQVWRTSSLGELTFYVGGFNLENIASL